MEISSAGRSDLECKEVIPRQHREKSNCDTNADELNRRYSSQSTSEIYLSKGPYQLSTSTKTHQPSLQLQNQEELSIDQLNWKNELEEAIKSRPALLALLRACLINGCSGIVSSICPWNKACNVIEHLGAITLADFRVETGLAYYITRSKLKIPETHPLLSLLKPVFQTAEIQPEVQESKSLFKQQVPLLPPLTQPKNKTSISDKQPVWHTSRSIVQSAENQNRNWRKFSVDVGNLRPKFPSKTAHAVASVLQPVSSRETTPLAPLRTQSTGPRSYSRRSTPSKSLSARNIKLEKLPRQPKTAEEAMAYLAMEFDTDMFKSQFYLNYANDMNPDSPFDPYHLLVVDRSQLNFSRHAIITREDLLTLFSGFLFVEPLSSMHVGLDVWARERALFNHLRKISVFRLYICRKTFQAWKQYKASKRFKRLTETIQQQAFICNPYYGPCLQQAYTRFLLLGRAQLFNIGLDESYNDEQWDKRMLEQLQTSLPEFVGTMQQITKDVLICTRRMLSAQTELENQQDQNTFSTAGLYVQRTQHQKLASQLHQVKEYLRRLPAFEALLMRIYEQLLLSIFCSSLRFEIGPAFGWKIDNGDAAQTFQHGRGVRFGGHTTLAVEAFEYNNESDEQSTNFEVDSNLSGEDHISFDCQAQENRNSSCFHQVNQCRTSNGTNEDCCQVRGESEDNTQIISAEVTKYHVSHKLESSRLPSEGFQTDKAMLSFEQQICPKITSAQEALTPGKPTNDVDTNQTSCMRRTSETSSTNRNSISSQPYNEVRSNYIQTSLHDVTHALLADTTPNLAIPRVGLIHIELLIDNDGLANAEPAYEVMLECIEISVYRTFSAILTTLFGAVLAMPSAPSVMQVMSELHGLELAGECLGLYRKVRDTFSQHQELNVLNVKDTAALDFGTAAEGMSTDDQIDTPFESIAVKSLRKRLATHVMEFIVQTRMRHDLWSYIRDRLLTAYAGIVGGISQYSWLGEVSTFVSSWNEDTFRSWQIKPQQLFDLQQQLLEWKQAVAAVPTLTLSENNLVRLECRQLQLHILPRIQAIINDLDVMLTTSIRADYRALAKLFSMEVAKLRQDVNMTHPTSQEYAKVVAAVHRAQLLQSTFDTKYSVLTELMKTKNRIFEQLCIGIDMTKEVQQAIADLDASWSEFSSLLSAAQNLVKVLEPTMVAKLTEMIRSRELQAVTIREVITKGIYLHPHSRISKALSGIFSAGRELSSLKLEVQSYCDALATISGKTLPLVEVYRTEQVLELRKAIWTQAKLVSTSLQMWMVLPYRDIALEIMWKTAREWVSHISALQEKIQIDPVLLNLQRNIQTFLDLSETLLPMADEKVSHNHWMLLFAALGAPYDEEQSFTLRKLEVLGVLHHRATIKDINVTAIVEATARTWLKSVNAALHNDSSRLLFGFEQVQMQPVTTLVRAQQLGSSSTFKAEEIQFVPFSASSTHQKPTKRNPPNISDGMNMSAHVKIGHNGSTLTAVPARTIQQYSNLLKKASVHQSHVTFATKKGSINEFEAHLGVNYTTKSECDKPDTSCQGQQKVDGSVEHESQTSIYNSTSNSDDRNNQRTLILSEAHCRSIIATALSTRTVAELYIQRSRLGVFEDIIEGLRQLLSEMHMIHTTITSLQEMQRKWIYVCGGLTNNKQLQAIFPLFRQAVDFDEQVRALLVDIDANRLVNRILRSNPVILSGMEFQEHVESLLSIGDLLSKEMNKFIYREQLRRMPDLWFIQGEPDFVLGYHTDLHRSDIKAAILACMGGPADFLFMDPAETQEKDLDDVSCCVYGLRGMAGDAIIFEHPVLIRRTQPLDVWYNNVATTSSNELKQQFYRSMNVLGLYCPPETKAMHAIADPYSIHKRPPNAIFRISISVEHNHPGCRVRLCVQDELNVTSPLAFVHGDHLSSIHMLECVIGKICSIDEAGELDPYPVYMDWLRISPEQVIWMSIEAMMCEVVERLVHANSLEDSVTKADQISNLVRKLAIAQLRAAWEQNSKEPVALPRWSSRLSSTTNPDPLLQHRQMTGFPPAVCNALLVFCQLQDWIQFANELVRHPLKEMVWKQTAKLTPVLRIALGATDHNNLSDIAASSMQMNPLELMTNYTRYMWCVTVSEEALPYGFHFESNPKRDIKILPYTPQSLLSACLRGSLPYLTTAQLPSLNALANVLGRRLRRIDCSTCDKSSLIGMVTSAATIGDLLLFENLHNCSNDIAGQLLHIFSTNRVLKEEANNIWKRSSLHHTADGVSRVSLGTASMSSKSHTVTTRNAPSSRSGSSTTDSELACLTSSLLFALSSHDVQYNPEKHLSKDAVSSNRLNDPDMGNSIYPHRFRVYLQLLDLPQLVRPIKEYTVRKLLHCIRQMTQCPARFTSVSLLLEALSSHTNTSENPSAVHGLGLLAEVFGDIQLHFSETFPEKLPHWYHDHIISATTHHLAEFGLQRSKHRSLKLLQGQDACNDRRAANSPLNSSPYRHHSHEHIGVTDGQKGNMQPSLYRLAEEDEDEFENETDGNVFLQNENTQATKVKHSVASVEITKNAKTQVDDLVSGQENCADDEKYNFDSKENHGHCNKTVLTNPYVGEDQHQIPQNFPRDDCACTHNENCGVSGHVVDQAVSIHVSGQDDSPKISHSNLEDTSTWHVPVMVTETNQLSDTTHYCSNSQCEPQFRISPCSSRCGSVCDNYNREDKESDDEDTSTTTTSISCHTSTDFDLSGQSFPRDSFLLFSAKEAHYFAAVHYAENLWMLHSSFCSETKPKLMHTLAVAVSKSGRASLPGMDYPENLIERFSNMQNILFQDDLLTRCLSMLCIQRCLTQSPSLTRKVHELVKTLCTYQAVVVDGDACVGKSTLISLAIEVMIWLGTARSTISDSDKQAVLPDLPNEARAHVMHISADTMSKYELRDYIRKALQPFVHQWPRMIDSTNAYKSTRNKPTNHIASNGTRAGSSVADLIGLAHRPPRVSTAGSTSSTAAMTTASTAAVVGGSGIADLTHCPPWIIIQTNNLDHVSESLALLSYDELACLERYSVRSMCAHQKNAASIKTLFAANNREYFGKRCSFASRSSFDSQSSILHPSQSHGRLSVPDNFDHGNRCGSGDLGASFQRTERMEAASHERTRREGVYRPGCGSVGFGTIGGVGMANRTRRVSMNTVFLGLEEVMSSPLIIIETLEHNKSTVLTSQLSKFSIPAASVHVEVTNLTSSHLVEQFISRSFTEFPAMHYNIRRELQELLVKLLPKVSEYLRMSTAASWSAVNTVRLVSRVSTPFEGISPRPSQQQQMNGLNPSPPTPTNNRICAERQLTVCILQMFAARLKKELGYNARRKPNLDSTRRLIHGALLQSLLWPMASLLDTGDDFDNLEKWLILNVVEPYLDSCCLIAKGVVIDTAPSLGLSSSRIAEQITRSTKPILRSCRLDVTTGCLVPFERESFVRHKANEQCQPNFKIQNHQSFQGKERAGRQAGFPISDRTAENSHDNYEGKRTSHRPDLGDKVRVSNNSIGINAGSYVGNNLPSLSHVCLAPHTWGVADVTLTMMESNMSVLMIGDAGSGKTSLIRALAQRLARARTLTSCFLPIETALPGEVERQLACVGLRTAVTKQPAVILLRNAFLNQYGINNDSGMLGSIRTLLERRMISVSGTEVPLFSDVALVATTLPLLDLNAETEVFSGLNPIVAQTFHHLVPIRIPPMTDSIELVRPTVSAFLSEFVQAHDLLAAIYPNEDAEKPFNNLSVGVDLTSLEQSLCQAINDVHSSISGPPAWHRSGKSSRRTTGFRRKIPYVSSVLRVVLQMRMLVDTNIAERFLRIDSMPIQNIQTMVCILWTIASSRTYLSYYESDNTDLLAVLQICSEQYFPTSSLSPEKIMVKFSSLSVTDGIILQLATNRGKIAETALSCTAQKIDHILQLSFQQTNTHLMSSEHGLVTQLHFPHVAKSFFAEMLNLLATPFSHALVIGEPGWGRNTLIQMACSIADMQYYTIVVDDTCTAGAIYAAYMQCLTRILPGIRLVFCVRIQQREIDDGILAVLALLLSNGSSRETVFSSDFSSVSSRYTTGSVSKDTFPDRKSNRHSYTHTYSKIQNPQIPQSRNTLFQSQPTQTYKHKVSKHHHQRWNTRQRTYEYVNGGRTHRYHYRHSTRHTRYPANTATHDTQYGRAIGAKSWLNNRGHGMPASIHVAPPLLGGRVIRVRPKAASHFHIIVTCSPATVTSAGSCLEDALCNQTGIGTILLLRSVEWTKYDVYDATFAMLRNYGNRFVPYWAESSVASRDSTALSDKSLVPEHSIEQAVKELARLCTEMVFDGHAAHINQVTEIQNALWLWEKQVRRFVDPRRGCLMVWHHVITVFFRLLRQVGNQLEQDTGTVHRLLHTLTQKDIIRTSFVSQLQEVESHASELSHELDNLQRMLLSLEKRQEKRTAYQLDCETEAAAAQALYLRLRAEVNALQGHVRPQIEHAVSQLKSLQKSDLDELRTYVTPPPIVTLITSPLCLLFRGVFVYRDGNIPVGDAPPTWQEAKALLQQEKIFHYLEHYSLDFIPSAMLGKLQYYTSQPDYHPDRAGQASICCKFLCMWVLAVTEYVSAMEQCKPSLNNLRQATERYEQAEKVLINVREEESAMAKEHVELEGAIQDVKERIKVQAADQAVMLAKLKRLDIIAQSTNHLHEMCLSRQKDLLLRRQQLPADVMQAAGQIVLLNRVVGSKQHHLRKSWIGWFVSSWLPSAKPFVLHKAIPLIDGFKAKSGNDQLWQTFDALWAVISAYHMALPPVVIDNYDMILPIMKDRNLAQPSSKLLPKKDFWNQGCMINETENGLVHFVSSNIFMEEALQVVVSSIEPELEAEWQASQELTFSSRQEDESFEQDLLTRVTSVKAEEFDDDQLLRSITQLKHKQKNGRRRRINKLWVKAALYEKRERYRPVADILSRLYRQIDALMLVSYLERATWHQTLHYYARCLLGRGQLSAASATSSGQPVGILSQSTDTAVAILCENMLSYTVDMLVEQTGPQQTKAAIVTFLLTLLLDQQVLSQELLDVFIYVTTPENPTSETIKTALHTPGVGLDSSPPSWLPNKTSWPVIVKLSDEDGFEALIDSLHAEEESWSIYLEHVPSLLELQPYERDQGDMETIFTSFHQKTAQSKYSPTSGRIPTKGSLEVHDQLSHPNAHLKFSEQLFRRLIVCVAICPQMYTDLLWQYVVLHLGSSVIPKVSLGLGALIQGQFDGFCPPSLYHRRVILLRYNPSYDLPTRMYELIQKTKLKRAATIIASHDLDSLHDSFTGLTSAMWVVIICSHVSYLEPLHNFLMEQANSKRQDEHSLSNVIVLCPFETWEMVRIVGRCHDEAVCIPEQRSLCLTKNTRTEYSSCYLQSSTSINQQNNQQHCELMNYPVGGNSMPLGPPDYRFPTWLPSNPTLLEIDAATTTTDSIDLCTASDNVSRKHEADQCNKDKYSPVQLNSKSGNRHQNMPLNTQQTIECHSSCQNSFSEDLSGLLHGNRVQYLLHAPVKNQDSYLNGLWSVSSAKYRRETSAQSLEYQERSSQCHVSNDESFLSTAPCGFRSNYIDLKREATSSVRKTERENDPILPSNPVDGVSGREYEGTLKPQSHQVGTIIKTPRSKIGGCGRLRQSNPVEENRHMHLSERHVDTDGNICGQRGVSHIYANSHNESTSDAGDLKHSKPREGDNGIYRETWHQYRDIQQSNKQAARSSGVVYVSSDVTSEMEHYSIDVTQDFLDAQIDPCVIACMLRYQSSISG